MEAKEKHRLKEHIINPLSESQVLSVRRFLNDRLKVSSDGMGAGSSNQMGFSDL